MGRFAFLVAGACALALACGCSRPAPERAAAGRAAILPERYAQSIAALGYPGARRAFQVGHGSVVSTGEAALEWRLESGSGAVTISPVWFERDGVPVAHWTMTAGARRVSFEAAAVLSEALGDTSLLCSVRATAECDGNAPLDFALEARVRGLPDGPHAVPWDAPERWSFDEMWRDRLALRNGRVVAAVDRAAELGRDAPSALRPARVEGTGPGRLVARCVARLAPGEKRSWDFWLPLYPIAAGGPMPGGNADHDVVVSRARRLWRETIDRATTFETPDTLANLAWRAAIVTLVACQERHDGRWVPIGNPFQYRDVWLRDGARVVRALAIAGLEDFARDDALALAEFQMPSGAFLSQRGQLDGTGQALWAFEQASALGDDDALARQLAPAATTALDWIRRQRAGTRTLQLDWPGLLPYGDPRDGELVTAPIVGNDAWAIAGCDAAAALARRARDTTLAARADSEAADYRRAFGAALAHTRHPDVPPAWTGGGRDWGNTSVAYPTRALAASDPRVAALARRLLERAPPPGLLSYGPEDSLHTYHGADLAEWALLAGKPALARGWLAALLGSSSATLGQAEIFSRANGGFGDNLPPHTTAAAVLVDLLRNMIVSDFGDTLEIALGADSTWWDGTRLERAPTRFGAASVRLSRPAPDRLAVRLDPIAAPLGVRVPDGWRADEPNAAGYTVEPGGRRIVAPARTTRIEFTVRREGAP